MDASPELTGIVRPASCEVAPVVVVERAAALDAPLSAAAARMRSAAEPPGPPTGLAGWGGLPGPPTGLAGWGGLAEITAAVRAMYRRVGIDPTKTRPSSEALLRRIRKGGELPRINSLVDIINWCSLESQLPFGLYDLDRIQGTIVLRIGTAGEEYPGIRKEAVHVAGRLTLADDLGPFGNPTSDSARTMVTAATTRALVVIFAPAPVPAADVDQVLELTRARIREFCQP